MSDAFNEDLYRQNKQKDLQKLLDEFAINIDWIWIGKASRRKVSLQVDVKNNLGYFAEKSHNVIEISTDENFCPEINTLILPLKNFLKKQEENLYQKIIITAFDNILDVIFCAKRKLNLKQEQQLITFAKDNKINISSLINQDLSNLLILQKNQIFYKDFKINLSGDIFIQASKEGLQNIIKIIAENISQNSKVLDLYAGFGAYSFAICNIAKEISAFEGDEKMVKLIKENALENQLSQKIKAQMRDLFFNPLSAKELNDFDAIIINPPRNGAETQAKEIAKSNLKKVIYVSCNPQSFKRDAKNLIASGFHLKSITAIDQFYQTSHLELVSILEK